LLVEKGADLNVLCGGESILLLACRSSCHVDIIELLLSHGVALESRSAKGSSPFWIACQEGNLEIATLLESKGANINHKINDGASSLYIASQNGCIKVVEFLVSKKVRVDEPGAGGATSLYIAAQCGRTEVMDILIAAGANVNKINNIPSGGLCNTAVCTAARVGHLKAVELLVSKGALVSKESVFCAILSNHGQVLEFLLSKRTFGINECIGNQLPPLLWYAASEGQDNIIKILLSHGADVNVKSKEKGSTPLYIASNKGYLKTMEILLSRGACVHERDNDQYSPIMIATMGFATGNCTVSFNNGPPMSNRPDHNKDRIACMELLLDHGADPNDTTDYALEEQFSFMASGRPFGFAYQGGNIEAVKLLLSRGASIPKSLGSFAVMKGKGKGDVADRTIERWPMTMVIILLRELRLFSRLDDSLLDLQEFMRPIEKKATLEDLFNF
jgi:ankyrin repeat protein